MGYDLERDDESTSINLLGWQVALTLAKLGGWKPAGATETPHGHLLKRPPDYHDGRFSEADAHAFAMGIRAGIERGLLDDAFAQAYGEPNRIMSALSAAVPGAKFQSPGGEWQERMNQIAEFASRGSFWVGL